jgi:hypothetical protein
MAADQQATVNSTTIVHIPETVPMSLPAVLANPRVKSLAGLSAPAPARTTRRESRDPDDHGIGKRRCVRCSLALSRARLDLKSIMQAATLGER